MPPSIDVLTSSSAPAWPTMLMALKSPFPSPNVMVPKQSFETRRPVLPRVAYSMMPFQLLSTHSWRSRNKNEAAQGQAASIASVRLENKLRLQFDYPWRCIRTQTRAIDGRRLTNGLRDLTELAAVHVGIREGKVRMIEEIKEPCANGELSALPPRYREGLLHIEVGVEVARAAKLIAALGPEIICWVSEISSAITRIG